MATAKERLQQKIQAISEFEAIEVLDFIEYVEQKRERELEESLRNAPVEEEELTPEETEAIKEAEEDIKAGRVINAEEVWKSLGL